MMTLHPRLRGCRYAREVPLAVLVALAGVLTGCGSSGAEARAMVAAGAVLLDVTPHARAERSLIEGRTHIPLSELAARMGELPRDRDIVVYCLGGGASPRAGARLRAAGYRAFVMGAKTNWDL